MFRAPDLATAGRMFAGMAGFGGGAGSPQDWAALMLLAGAAAVAFLAPNGQTIALERLKPSRWLAPLLAIALVAAVIEAGTEAEVPFVYFQF